MYLVVGDWIVVIFELDSVVIDWILVWTGLPNGYLVLQSGGFVELSPKLLRTGAFATKRCLYLF